VKSAVATSIPVGLILSLAVSVTFGSRGVMDYALVASLMVGCVVSLPLASKLFSRFSEESIKRITGLFIGLALIGLVEALLESLNIL
jgi:uncharacterized membrane protein YfcA